MTFGVTDAGFVLKRQPDIIKDIQDRHRASFGTGIDVAIATELGQIDGDVSSELAELWELAQIAYNAYDPSKADNAALVAISALTGTIKEGDAPSTAPITVNLNAGITLPAGTLCSVIGRPDILFQLLVSATNAGGSAADISTGTDSKPLVATCTQAGPIVVVAGTLTVRATIIGGWNNVTNTADATPGRFADTNIQLRQRREDELALRGGSTARAIKADMLDTEHHPELIGIRSCAVLTNRTDDIDTDGLLPHSFEVLIDDGDSPTVANDAIAQSIFDSGPDGINTNGSATGTAVDENGDSQIMRFSRVTLRPVYFAYTLQKGAAYPVDGDAQVKAAVLQLGTTIGAGQEIVALAFKAVALSVAGVIDVTAFALDFAPSPTATANLSPSRRERATFDSAHISIA